MKPPYPSVTPTWHNDVYSAIEYSNPNVSHEGETIVITGAGGGLGSETAVSFSSAGARHVVLIGRNEAKLRETEGRIAALNKSTKVSVFVADVTDEAAIKRVAEAVGTWDAVLHCAGYMNEPGHAASCDIDDYWKAYEVNVKGSLIVAKSFVPTANTEHATFVSSMSGSVAFPTQMLAGLSGYQCSKIALAKTMEFLSVETPTVRFITVHPGMLDTPLFRASGATPDMLAMDTPNLPAGFNLWVTLPEAKFLNGKFVYANWDVDELKGMKDELANKLTVGIEGWPFPHTG